MPALTSTSTQLPLSATAGSPSPLPQTDHPLLGQGCRALTSLSPLPTTPHQEARGVSEGRKGRAEQCLPEMTVTGTGSQHSLFINLWTTESKGSISTAYCMLGPQAHCTPVDSRFSLGTAGRCGTHRAGNKSIPRAKLLQDTRERGKVTYSLHQRLPAHRSRASLASLCKQKHCALSPPACTSPPSSHGHAHLLPPRRATGALPLAQAA